MISSPKRSTIGERLRETGHLFWDVLLLLLLGCKHNQSLLGRVIVKGVCKYVTWSLHPFKGEDKRWINKSIEMMNTHLLGLFLLERVNLLADVIQDYLVIQNVVLSLLILIV